MVLAGSPMLFICAIFRSKAVSFMVDNYFKCGFILRSILFAILQRSLEDYAGDIKLNGVCVYLNRIESNSIR